MKNLQASLGMADLEVLLEAMSEWENLGNHDYYMMQQVKNMPIPTEEESEQWNKIITQLKSHYANREKTIKSDKQVREEKAVFTRAKLMMIRQAVAANMLWNNPEDAGSDEPAPAPVKKVAPPIPKKEMEDFKRKYEIAVEYMTDMKIMKFFEPYLEEHLKEVPANETVEESD